MTFTPTWRMVYLDWNANPVGEIVDAHDRKLSFPLNRPHLAEFKLDITNSLCGSMLTNKGGLILVYRGSTLVLTAETTSLRPIGGSDEKSLAVVATETMWPRLQHALIGLSSAGYKVTSATDKGLIMFDALDAVNTTWDRTIAKGTRTATTNATAGPYYYKPWMELCQELALTTSGFDFWQVPKVPVPTTNNLYNTGDLWIASLKGSDKSDVVFFEYGAGTKANVREYSYLQDTTNLLNTGYVLPPDYPSSAGRGVATAGNIPSLLVYGLRQEVIPSDLVDSGLRSALAQSHVDIRNVPMQVFLFQPTPDDGTGRTPVFPVDFDVGDRIRGRVNDYGTIMLDAIVRVYGVTVELDDAGLETQTLELSLNTT